MATVFIDYDSNGDVELILEQKHDPPLHEAAEQASQLSEQEESSRYNVGALSIKVKEFRLRVSSVKLTSSSDYFRAMLEGSGFREGEELKAHGSVSIELSDPEDEPTAMMIILGILYENNVQVPSELDLPTLEKVAVLVDKYQWHVLVTPRAISWFDRLLNSKGLPDNFDETVLTWLFIAWQFGIKDHFKALSKVAQQDASYSIDLRDESIRLPTRVLEAINEQRDAAFQKVEQALETFKARLLDYEARECQENGHEMLKWMMDGFVTFCSKGLELAEFAAPDHAGRSIRSLRNDIKLTRSMNGIFVRRYIRDGQYVSATHRGGIWELKDELQGAINDLKIDEWGLDYDDFRPSHASNRQNRNGNTVYKAV